MDKTRRYLLLFAVFFLILVISSVYATELDLKINAKLSDFDTDFYFQTASDASLGYDYLDSLMPSFPNGNYSFLYSNIASKNLTNDAWPASNRTFYLVYRVNPSTSGSLILSWSSSAFGYNYSATLTDYGSDSSYTSSISAVNMKTDSSYSTSFSGLWRYFTMTILYAPIYCGDRTCNGDETCSSCSDDCGTCSTGGCTPDCGDTSAHCLGTTYSNGCFGGSNACTGTRTPDCGTRTCGSAPNGCGSCGSCSSGSCVNGICTSCTPHCPVISLTPCGQSLGDNGCGETCFGTGTFCASGTCNGLTCIPCSEDWSCGDWGVCNNGIQTRVCSDLNSCGTTNSKPVTNQLCIVPACISDSDCTSSNSCITGRCDSITKKCVYLNNQNSCNDGNACTLNDVCFAGSCSGVSKVCDLGFACLDGTCVEGNKPDPEDIPQDLVRVGALNCKPEFVCGDFSKCEASYDLSNLITGSESSGFQTQVCIDKNKCLADFSNQKSCSVKEDVTVLNGVWCGQNYTQVIDSNGKIVARVRQSITGKFINVDFNAAGDAYCAYCFDGIKNYDEEAVDCGGSCMACSEIKIVSKKPFYSTDFFKLGVSLVSFFAFLVFFLVIISSFIKLSKETNTFDFILRKYSKWKKEGYDVGVLYREINFFRNKK